jgi:FAD binding domain
MEQFVVPALQEPYRAISTFPIRPSVSEIAIMPLILDSSRISQSQSDSLNNRRREHHEADVLIVGAGIAGCALAVALGKQGRSVILLEKNLKEPDRIVGELLQPGGVWALEKLGIEGAFGTNTEWKVWFGTALTWEC